MVTSQVRHRDRILVRDGRRHHRRTYSPTELKSGAIVLAILALVVFWVAWKGAHPDPELFGEAMSDVEPGKPVALEILRQGKKLTVEVKPILLELDD